MSIYCVYSIGINKDLTIRSDYYNLMLFIILNGISIPSGYKQIFFFPKEQLHQSARFIVVILNALIFHLVTSEIGYTLGALGWPARDSFIHKP